MDITREELCSIIRDIIKNELSSLVESQIDKFYFEGFTYKEIGRCVYYFYVIKNNDVAAIEQYGIGIIRNIRKEANLYYDNIKKKQEQQRSAAEGVLNQGIKTVEITPAPRTFKRRVVNIDGIKQ